MEFKDSLRTRRIERGLTQEALAKQIYVSRSLVAKWESGKALPNENTLKVLEEFFNSTDGHLITFKEKLVKYRLLKAMSQQELADKLDVSLKKIIKYESGLSYPNNKRFKRIASILDVKEYDLYAYDYLAKRNKDKKIMRISIICAAVVATVASCIAFNEILYRRMRNGKTVSFSAKKIGTEAVKTAKRITIEGHTFTYKNVKSNKDGEWILMDETSYIVNTDMIFGFRYKNDLFVEINSYNGSEEPRHMSSSDRYPGYANYQVFNGFILTIKKDAQYYPELGVNIGVLQHWC
ncbi:MAG: transcriptional regulator [Bacilli bacterium]|nr:transcriptional regulator [Bacilli bacterium]